MSSGARAALVRAASAYYRPAGQFAWRFAGGKLRADPVFPALLEEGLLGESRTLLDLGCGQGLLAAWLLAARTCHAREGQWPAHWPPPPPLERYTGIEIHPQEVRRARAAFALDPGLALQIVHGDIRDVDYGAPDAIVILDVLHYLDRAAQQQVLQRVRRALAPQGRLVMRVGDASAGFGCALSRAVDGTVALLRRRRWIRLQCRPVREWVELLERLGFAVRRRPLKGRTPFVNVLLIAQAR
ncbi:MAG: class I SAM-dependent methyltransferase [Gammaproteobacteria bacterium]|nr:class I SAM-dependent methyltransferase [Gammaproteobacteria bacterium]